MAQKERAPSVKISAEDKAKIRKTSMTKEPSQVFIKTRGQSIITRRRLTNIPQAASKYQQSNDIDNWRELDEANR